MKIKILTLIILVTLSLSCSYFSKVPSNVVSFIQQADKVELITDAKRVNGSLEFAGDMIKRESLKADITDRSVRSEVLSAFLADTAWGDGAACFIPLHILRATKGEQVVEIEICYSCSRFVGGGDLGTFSGDIGFGTSQKVLDRILAERGQEQ